MSIQANLRTVERIQTVLAGALRVAPKAITPELALGDLPQWDSLGHMEVMMSLEEHFGIEINADTIAELTSVPAICEHLAISHPTE
jgi:acyl carrier protein